MRFVITAGPTREPIDPVRYLSNRSSGKMGYAIAEAAAEAGHNVLLISGPVNLAAPKSVELISSLSSDEMYDAIHRHLEGADVVVMCAAVADYKPATVSPRKIKKQGQTVSLELIPTRDVLASLGKEDRQFLLVGFAAVAGRLLVEANQQLSQAREQIARLAVGEERLRFARDLHDLLGHSLSVIALKSELAGRLMKTTPGLAAHEVEDIENVARDALREVREAVTGYRQPTLSAELAGAREALTAAGMEFRAEQDHAGLPPVVEAVMAWAVREGVTNVMRHSQAKRCSVRISANDGHATVEVVDNGRGGAPEMGSGLRGLNERVLERGGTLTAAPLPHEGFRLRVTLPLPEAFAPVDAGST